MMPGGDAPAASAPVPAVDIRDRASHCDGPRWLCSRGSKQALS